MAKSKITLVECIVGIFAFNDQNKDIDVAFFPKKVKDIVEAIGKLQRGESVDEVIRLVKRLARKGYREFIFENDNLGKAVEELLSIKPLYEKPSSAGDHLRSNVGNLAITRGYVESLDEFYTLVHDVSVELTRINIKDVSEKRDLIVSQVVLTLDDLNKTINLFNNRLREWYGYHFPELWPLIDKSDLYVQLVASLGERYNFTVENLAKMLNVQRAETVAAVANASMGADMDKNDTDEIYSFSKLLLALLASRDRIECYLDDLMKRVAPNIFALVGPNVGAHLIAAAGSLENLSKKSSSTIQVLGAEKALFRSIKMGTRPPKHGLIFQHKVIHQSPRWQRGKIARSLAGKLAIAARLDFFQGDYRGTELKEEFDKRVEEIKEKYSNPPEK